MKAMRISSFALLVLTATHTVPAAEPGDTVTNSVGMKLAYIPPGEFTMGSPESERHRISNETQRRVAFKKAFRIGVTEVTQEQWREIMGTAPSYFKGDELPVERVTWQDADEFCRRLSAKENKRYRLPSQAEWEYACRAGTTTTYHTGKDEKALGEAGWYRRNGGNRSHPVGKKKSNPWGLYDMHGNVSEWCAKRGDIDVRLNSKSTRLEWEEARLRDLRGGSWGLNANDCRSATRLANAGSFRYFDLGLRVVREID